MARIDKKLFQLGADEVENIERAEELYQHLAKHKLEEGVKFVRQKWGINTSLRAMGEFRRQWPLEQVVLRLQGRIAASRRIVEAGGEEVTSLTPTNLKLLEQQITEMLAGGADEKRLSAFVKMFATLTKSVDMTEQTQLAGKKFEFDAAKAALKHAAELKKIAGDRTLNEGSRIEAARLKLFGVAA